MDGSCDGPSKTTVLIPLFGRLCEVFQAGKVTFRLQGGHAAHAGGGHGLAKHLVLDITGGEHPWDRSSRRIGLRDQITGRLAVQLALEQLGGRLRGRWL